MHAREIEIELNPDGRSWSEAQKFGKSERDMCHHMDQRAHPSKTTDVLEAQAHGKTKGTHHEASWPKTVGSGRAH